MGRRISGQPRRTTSSSRTAVTPARASAVKTVPPPAPASYGPTDAVQQPHGSGSIVSSVLQGMAFGGGSAMAHRAVEFITGPREIKYVYKGENDAAAAASSTRPATSSVGANITVCHDETMEFNKCAQSTADNLNSCQYVLDVLNQCRAKTDNGRENM